MHRYCFVASYDKTAFWITSCGSVTVDVDAVVGIAIKRFSDGIIGRFLGSSYDISTGGRTKVKNSSCYHIRVRVQSLGSPLFWPKRLRLKKDNVTFESFSLGCGLEIRSKSTLCEIATNLTTIFHHLSHWINNDLLLVCLSSLAFSTILLYYVLIICNYTFKHSCCLVLDNTAIVNNSSFYMF